MTERPLWFVAAGFVGLVCISMFACFSLWDAQVAFQDAERNLSQMATLQARIEELRKSESNAVISSERTEYSFADWTQIGAEASIAREKFVALDSVPLRVIEDSEYQLEDIGLKLQNVTFRKLTDFLTRCEIASDGFQASGLQLTAQTIGAVEGDETWNVDLILTRLVYVAKKPVRK